jgi:hypothetical protein
MFTEKQIESALCSRHNGQWYGFSDPSNKCYDTLIIHDDSIAKPSESEFNRWCSENSIAIVWKDIRAQRNQLLLETDWTANSDVTMSVEMTTYRQALRDLPETVDIDNPVFPDKPIT